MPSTLTESDLRVLDLLARRARLLTLSQLACALGASLPAARRWTERNALLIERRTVLARAPSTARVLAAFLEGSEVPDFDELARTLRSRAAANPVEAVDVVRLSAHGAALLGVKPLRMPRNSETSHDLQLAEFVVQLGSNVRSYSSEEDLIRSKRYAGTIPDGELTLSDGRTIALECGGESYTAKKLAAFHVRMTAETGGRIHGYWIV